jgi:hypothetical protein
VASDHKDQTSKSSNKFRKDRDSFDEIPEPPPSIPARYSDHISTLKCNQRRSCMPSPDDIEMIKEIAGLDIRSMAKPTKKEKKLESYSFISNFIPTRNDLVQNGLLNDGKNRKLGAS